MWYCVERSIKHSKLKHHTVLCLKQSTILSFLLAESWQNQKTGLFNRQRFGGLIRPPLMISLHLMCKHIDWLCLPARKLSGFEWHCGNKVVGQVSKEYNLKRAPKGLFYCKVLTEIQQKIFEKDKSNRHKWAYGFTVRVQSYKGNVYKHKTHIGYIKTNLFLNFSSNLFLKRISGSFSWEETSLILIFLSRRIHIIKSRPLQLHFF